MTGGGPFLRRWHPAPRRRGVARWTGWTPRFAAPAAAVLVTLLTAQLGAQSAVATTAGVYTDEQAARGRDVYLGNCKSCHVPETHTGELFRNAWHGRPLADLFTYVSTLMPKNEPGSLSPQENADVVAYLLKLNRIPAGVGEIPPDSTRLRSIRIDAPSPAAVRKDP